MDPATEPVPPRTRTEHTPNPHGQEIISSSDTFAEADDSEQAQDTAHTGHTAMTSTSTEPSQNPMPPPPNPRHAKLQIKISTLQSTIAATEAQLALKLQKITQLKSFPHQERSEPEPERGREREQEREQELDTAAPSPSPSPASTQTHAQAQAHAQSIITQHITLLKRYNEIKDFTSGMLSLIADKQGRRLADVMAERGLSERD